MYFDAITVLNIDVSKEKKKEFSSSSNNTRDGLFQIQIF